jgi:hypothetical protein
MRHALFFSAMLSAAAGCAPALRTVGISFSSSLPPVHVAHGDSTSEFEIVLAREVLDGWNFLFLSITETEFALCLEGTKDKGRLSITGFRLAHIISSHGSAVEYVPCDGPYHVGTAHNHLASGYPGQDNCYQSGKDHRSFQKDSKAFVDIILCGRNRFVWVLKDGKAPRIWSGSSQNAQK